MNKRVLSFIIINVFFIAAAVSAKVPTGKSSVTDQVGMYSYRVKGMKSLVSKDSDGKVKKRIVIERYSDGRIRKKIHYFGNMKPKLTIDYKYDSSKRLDKKLKVSPEGEVLRTHKYYYCKRNRVIMESVKDHKKSREKKIYYYYNRAGERIRKCTYDSKGQLKGMSLYVFGTDGKRTRDYSLKNTGEIRSITRYIYNSKGQISKKESMKPDNELRSYSLNSYDGWGRKVLGKTYDKSGKVKYTMEYSYE